MNKNNRTERMTMLFKKQNKKKRRRKYFVNQISKCLKQLIGGNINFKRSKSEIYTPYYYHYN
jgi:hypothetical protein